METKATAGVHAFSVSSDTRGKRDTLKRELQQLEVPVRQAGPTGAASRLCRPRTDALVVSPEVQGGRLALVDVPRFPGFDVVAEMHARIDGDQGV